MHTSQPVHSHPLSPYHIPRNKNLQSQLKHYRDIFGKLVRSIILSDTAKCHLLALLIWEITHICSLWVVSSPVSPTLQAITRQSTPPSPPPPLTYHLLNQRFPQQQPRRCHTSPTNVRINHRSNLRSQKEKPIATAAKKQTKDSSSLAMSFSRLGFVFSALPFSPLF